MSKIFKSGKLNCTFCKELLRPPIYIAENIGTICNKCHQEHSNLLSENKCIKSPLMEEILEELELPCVYESFGCNRILTYNEMIEHSSICIYIPKKCFYYEMANCRWEGPQKNFTNHINDQHNENKILSLDYKFENVLDLNTIKMLECNGNIYFSMCNITETDLQYFLYNSINETENFNLTLSYENNSLRIKGCTITFDEFYKKQNPIKISLETIKRFLEDPRQLTTYLKILKKDWEGDLKSIVYQVLECKICNNLMEPPIPTCIAGHTICSTCQKEVSACPVCRGLYKGTRNFGLETLTSEVKYPCSNEGCPISTFKSAMADHKANCNFNEYSCPVLDCPHEAVNDFTFVTHLEKQHKELLVENNFQQSFSYESDFEEIFFCLLYDKPFQISMRLSDSQFQCAVAVVCLKECEQRFNYEITFIKTNGSNLTMRYRCHNKRKDDIFEGCETFDNEFLEKFLQDDEFSIKCKITKVKKILNN